MRSGRRRKLLEVPGSPHLLGECQRFSRQALQAANLAEPWVSFLHHLVPQALEFFDCDGVGLWFVEGRSCLVCEGVRGAGTSVTHRMVPWPGEDGEPGVDLEADLSPLDRLCGEILAERLEKDPAFFTPTGIFFTHDTHRTVRLTCRAGGRPDERTFDIRGDYRSVLVVPLPLDSRGRGLLVLGDRATDAFSENEFPAVQATAQNIGMAATHYRTQAALRERVKELGCLYGISKIVETPRISLDEILCRVAELLPPAWQYPKIARARIVLDGRSYGESEIEESWQNQTAEIYSQSERRGVVEVAYSRRMPDLEEGPFLKEERHLIETAAVQVAQIIERHKAKEDRVKLRRQLRHADRLATIGQLAAGVAHEFNEPLGNILGFAELVLKNSALPPEAREDVQKIAAASLHAREVVRKLMWFAREMPPRRVRVNFNTVVREGLYLLEARCQKAGIEVVYALAANLPEVTADPAQLHQVLMNLVVNAIQAMPEGGTITISTAAADGAVKLGVQDTGIGMSDEMLGKIFLPFFTTKDVDQGTGLGLAVVHGIVTSHGGTITVQSRAGEGSKFEIRLPIHGQPEGAGRE